MKTKESPVRYDAIPSVPIMRGRLIKALENEENSVFIRTMYITMNQLRNASSVEKSHIYSLSELKGILALDNDEGLSYDDMRQAYMQERYSL